MEHWREQGNRLRALLNRAIAGQPSLTHSALSESTGIDEKQIGRSLRDDGGAHPPLALVAAILAGDSKGVIISGLGDLLGYDVTRRTPDLAAENQRLREQLTAIRALLNATSEP